MRYYLLFKRLLDLFLSSIGLLVFSPFCYLILIFIKLDSPGPVFFKQKRIGRHLKPFQLVKFRSMSVSGDVAISEFDPGDHRRVTRVGSFLRKTKLDEFPELFNVLNGHMSIVGPRPEVAYYVQAYPEDFKLILKIRPGLSDLASIKYRNEEAILAGQPDPEAYYLNVILPDKLHLAKLYVKNVSFTTDLRIIIDTIKGVVKGNPGDKGWRR
jgi:lipopolysaccharide/colanic/teichoic acid biosynthesis glycosyltransferase